MIVGEDFSFDVDYEERTLLYLLYGSHAIAAWKCGSVMPSDVNHIDDPGTKEKLKAAMMARESGGESGVGGGGGGGANKRKKGKKGKRGDFLSDKI